MLDFPKSASTDKSRIESFLSGKMPAVTASLHHDTAAGGGATAGGSNGVDPSPSSLRVSHSYRNKSEMQSAAAANSHIPVTAAGPVGGALNNNNNNTNHHHPSATSTVGTAATYLTSTLNSTTNQMPTTTGAIKSQSAAPIKLAADSVSSSSNSNAMSQSMQRSELRPRYVVDTFLLLLLSFVF